MWRPRPRPQAATRADDAVGFVTADGAALKKEPSLSAVTVGRLTTGARLTLVADLGRWYQVRTGAGESGFLSVEAVEKESDRQAREKRAKTIASFPPVYGLVAEDTDVRLAPFPHAPKSGRLARGTVIAIHSVDHAFYAFKTEAGQIAFINSADVDLVPSDPSKPEIKPARDKAVKNLTVTDSSPPPPEAEPEVANSPPLPAAAGAAAEDAGRRSPPPSSAAEATEAAVLVSHGEPSYPERARRAGIEGIVELEVSIAADGFVTNVEVVRGLPFGLSESAAKAVRRWKYRPARGRDGPVASRKAVRILFTLGH